jgi:hypothetical protein
MKRITRIAEDQGWEVSLTGGGHYKFLSPDPSVPPIYTSQTPSDYRALLNFKSRLRRSGLRLKNERTQNMRPRRGNPSRRQHLKWGLAALERASDAYSLAHQAGSPLKSRVRDLMAVHAEAVRAYWNLYDARDEENADAALSLMFNSEEGIMQIFDELLGDSYRASNPHQEMDEIFLHPMSASEAVEEAGELLRTARIKDQSKVHRVRLYLLAYMRAVQAHCLSGPSADQDRAMADVDEEAREIEAKAYYDLIEMAEELESHALRARMRDQDRHYNGHRRAPNTHDPDESLEDAREATDVAAKAVRSAEVSAREGDHDAVINHLARADRALGMAEVYTSYARDSRHSSDVPGLEERQRQLGQRIEKVRGAYGYCDHEADVQTRLANSARLKGRLTEI